MKTSIRRLACWLLLGIVGVGSNAEPVRGKHSSAELLAEFDAVPPGGVLWLGVRVRLDKGWHTYWKNPGESGMAPRFSWDVSEGLRVGEAHFEYPVRFESDGIVSFGYEDETLFLFPVTVSDTLEADRVRMGLKVTWLVCKDLCLPETARLELGLAVGESAPESRRHEDVFARARARLPADPEGWDVSAALNDDRIVLRVAPPEGIAPVRSVAFYPAEANQFSYESAGLIRPLEGNSTLALALSPLAEGPPDVLAGVLVWIGSDGVQRALNVRSPVE